MCPAFMIESWHWCLFGTALVIFEIFIPGAFLLWIGGASVITGVVSYLNPYAPLSELMLLFLVLSLIFCWISRYFKFHKKKRSYKMVKK